MSNLANYSGFALEEAQEDKNKYTKTDNEINYLKFKPGDNVIRVLPARNGEKPFAKVYQHFVKTPKGTVSFRCPRVAEGRPCLVCEKSSTLKASSNEDERDLGYDMAAKLRVYCNVIDRSEPEKGVQVASFGKQIYAQLSSIRDDKVAGGDFTHPLKGFDLSIQKSGSGKNGTSYIVKAARDNTSLLDTEEEMVATLDSQPNLDENFNRVLSDEDIRLRLSGKRKEDNDKPKAVESGVIDTGVVQDDQIPF